MAKTETRLVKVALSTKCENCKAPATIDMFHLEQATKRDMFWKRLCNNCRSQELVYQKPGWIWHDEKVVL